MAQSSSLPGSLSDKAKKLLALHHGPKILVLPNAWDVASARIFEKAGFPAIATTSSGIANSLGYPDGQRITRNEMLVIVARIAGAVSVPMTADVEAGYSNKPEGAAETARRVIEAGAVGANLEDGTEEGSGRLVELPLQLEKIRAMIEAGAKAGVQLVLNARSDVYLNEVGKPGGRIDEIVKRLNAYLDAGAASVFAPGVTDAETIARLAQAIRGPLNILATKGTPPTGELEKLGVARVSVGGGPMRATMGLTARIAKQLREEGRYDLMFEYLMPFPEANALVAKR